MADRTMDGSAGGSGNLQDGFVEVPWAGLTARIEVRRIGDRAAQRPLIVFLHEGLGSVALWRDFPERLCRAVGCRGLVYSRPGYGRSLPPAGASAWTPDYMHRQALELLPALLAAEGADAPDDPPWLLGHSDGGSIALLYAARFPNRLAGAILLAPHIVVEPLSVASIAAAGDAYRTTDLPRRLAKYHDDADAVFRRWNAIWLAPEFRDWSIRDELDAIRCPLLAVQGLDDEYGTLAQILGIAARVPGTELLELPDCGHSSHRDQPDAVIAAVAEFVRRRDARLLP